MANAVNRFLGGSPLAVLFKLLVLSLVVGVILSALNIQPLELVHNLERLIRNIFDLGFDAIERVIGYVILGAVVVVPIFLVMRLVRMGRE